MDQFRRLHAHHHHHFFGFLSAGWYGACFLMGRAEQRNGGSETRNRANTVVQDRRCPDFLEPVSPAQESESMTKFLASAKKFVQSEDAPTMVEYGLLVALIALIVAIAAAVLGKNVSTLF